MGFRFRRSIRLLPGIRINLGKRGLSATIGIRGAGVTLGASGTHLNLGLPGTGLSYRTRLDVPPQRLSRTDVTAPGTPAEIPEYPPSAELPFAQVIQFKSVDVASLGSESLSRVGELLEKLHRQRTNVSLEIVRAEGNARQAKSMAASLAWLRQRTAPAALASRREYAEACEDRLQALSQIKDSLVLGVEFNVGDEAMKRFEDVISGFDRVSQCNRIWDITSAERIDRARTRSAASQALDIRPVSFDRAADYIMATDFRPPFFSNDNGADLLFYPAFMAAQVAGRMALLDIRAIDIRVETVTFVVSDGTVPSDAEVVGNTWRYVNKNGQPDRRFSYNPSIPLARYCKIFFQGEGLNEAWMVSNAQSGLAFGEAVGKYKASLKGSESDMEGIAPPSADEWPDPELPEMIPPPLRDWKTPSVLYGGIATLVAAAAIVIWLLYPQFVPVADHVDHFPPARGTGEAPTKTGTNKLTPAAAVVPLGPAEIVDLQRLLKKAGFDAGPADGSAGPQTLQALTDWGRKQGIRNPKLDRSMLDAIRRTTGTDTR